MRRSDDRILTTHVGSLPRNAVLTDLLIRDEAGEAIDRAELRRQSESAVRYVVERQMASGIDIVNDGEQPRVGFQTYVAQRMRGFGGEIQAAHGRATIRTSRRSWRSFPIAIPRRSKVSNAPQAIAEVRYEDLAPAEDECRMFSAALRQAAVAAARDLHDGGVARHHRHDAAERALRQPRSLRLRAGAPDAQGIRADRARVRPADRCARPRAWNAPCSFQDKSVAEFLKIAEMHVAALNEALAGIPRERIRLHCCWGNYDGPHIHDVPLADILPVLDPGARSARSASSSPTRAISTSMRR